MIARPNLQVVRPNSYQECEDSEQIVEIGDRLPPDVVRRLSVIEPTRWVRLMVLDWALALGASALCERFFHPVLYVATVLFIGARQQGLGVLMHEGVHFRAHRSKVVNEWLSDVFCAWPLGISTELYRSLRHFPHHKYIGMPDDPHRWQTYRTSWTFPKAWPEVVLLLVKEAALGPLNLAVVFALTILYSRGHVLRLARLLAWSGVIALVVTQGWTRCFLLYWMVPLAIWMPVLNAFRTMAEHCAVRGYDGEGEGSGTRTTITGWFGRTFLFPHNINLHIEHHAYPSVPFHRLPELSSLLRPRLEATNRYHGTRGYWQVWRELTGARDAQYRRP